MRVRRVTAIEDVHHDFSPEVLRRIRRQRAEQSFGDSRPIEQILCDMGMPESDVADPGRNGRSRPPPLTNTLAM
jgi:hypothetical protein